MFTPVEALLGWRYMRAQRRTRFVSFISAIAMLGVALGLAALITILSIMNGFERELRDRLLGMAAHITVTTDTDTMRDWRAIADAAQAFPDVLGAAPFVRREAMLTHYDNVNGAAVLGVDPTREARVSDVAAKFRGGNIGALQAGAFNVALGAGLAQALQARVGDQVSLIAPEPVRTPAGMVPRMKRFTVIAIVDAGVQEYDATLALMHLRDAATLFRLGSAAGGVRLKLEDPFVAPALAPRIAATLAHATDSTIEVTDWTAANVNLFRALKTEKIVMFVILALTIAVAAFNLVSTLVMVVAEKNAEIAVLQTLGLNRRGVLTAFFIYGGLVGSVGIVAGTLGGTFLAANADAIVAGIEGVLHVKILSPDVYYISEIPSLLQLRDVIAAVVVSIVLCFVAPLYPAYLASRTAPARALRYD